MRRDPNDLPRYTATERSNHWVVAIGFILLALSGLALFHPALFPLSHLFGGGQWTRILHPYVGVVTMLFFFALFFRFADQNHMGAADWEWLRRMREMMDGDDHAMPEMGKYNGGQKLLFWVFGACMLLLLLSGLALWRAWFSLPVGLVRVAAVVHAVTATVMILAVIVHIYAAIWVRGTVRAMLYGSVTRAWAKQHHRAWYRQLTGR